MNDTPKYCCNCGDWLPTHIKRNKEYYSYIYYGECTKQDSNYNSITKVGSEGLNGCKNWREYNE